MSARDDHLMQVSGHRTDGVRLDCSCGEWVSWDYGVRLGVLTATAIEHIAEHSDPEELAQAGRDAAVMAAKISDERKQHDQRP